MDLKVTAILRVTFGNNGGFCNGTEVPQGGCVINEATPPC